MATFVLLMAARRQPAAAAAAASTPAGGFPFLLGWILMGFFFFLFFFFGGWGFWCVLGLWDLNCWGRVLGEWVRQGWVSWRVLWRSLEARMDGG